MTVIDPRRVCHGTKISQRGTVSRVAGRSNGGLAPDAQTAVVTLAHDPKIDDPALMAALDSRAFYIGALGSRRTHESAVNGLRNRVLASLGQLMHRLA